MSTTNENSEIKTSAEDAEKIVNSKDEFPGSDTTEEAKIDTNEASAGKKSRRKIAIMAGSVLLCGALLIVAYFWYNGHYFVSTEDARVSADIVNVTAQMPGRIINLDVKAGDSVEQGQKLGNIDTSSVIGSTDVNLQSMSQSAGVNAYKSEIVAPISGKVIQISAKEGQSVSASLTVLMIANTDDIFIGANIEETKINSVKIGQLAEISIDAYPGQKFVGQVDSIGEAANSVFALVSMQSSNGNYTKVTQTIPIRIRFPELTQLDAKLGMNATIRIHIN
jgi:multidrug resistance efflux pump